jgi:hypothetical protein
MEAQIPVRVFTLAKCHLKKHHQQLLYLPLDMMTKIEAITFAAT